MIRAALLACGLLCTAAAHAAPPAPVEGAWAFTTSQYRLVEEDHGWRTYTIVKGDLRVGPANAAGEHTCDMRTTQNWYEQEDKAPPIVVETLSSVQTCTLKRDGDKITITGKIVSTSDEGYRADDFTLKLESASRMVGDMHSRWSNNQPVAKATFYRGPGAIS